MNKLLTIAASLVLSLIAGLNATLMAEEQSPNLKVQFDSNQLQPATQSDPQSVQAEPQLDLQVEQSKQSTTPCLACGMG